MTIFIGALFILAIGILWLATRHKHTDLEKSTELERMRKALRVEKK